VRLQIHRVHYVSCILINLILNGLHAKYVMELSDVADVESPLVLPKIRVNLVHRLSLCALDAKSKAINYTDSPLKSSASFVPQVSANLSNHFVLSLSQT